jgi:pimeloyl-ACP methyl ester carboxylesterase
VSHLILLNTAAASYEDFLILRQEVRRRKGVYEKELNALVPSTAYKEGDPEAVAAYYRIHFSTTVRHPEHLERLLVSMKESFTQDTILSGRAIEARLYEETWSSSDFDLFPQLERVHVPTLVIHGDDDFIPPAIAAHIAETIPGARFTLLQATGHFAYLESPDMVRKEISDFFGF